MCNFTKQYIQYRVSFVNLQRKDFDINVFKYLACLRRKKKTGLAFQMHIFTLYINVFIDVTFRY